jgi:hypothetical protein
MIGLQAVKMSGLWRLSFEESFATDRDSRGRRRSTRSGLRRDRECVDALVLRCLGALTITGRRLQH